VRQAGVVDLVVPEGSGDGWIDAGEVHGDNSWIWVRDSDANNQKYIPAHRCRVVQHNVSGTEVVLFFVRVTSG
jgi:hypothetical protein